MSNENEGWLALAGVIGVAILGVASTFLKAPSPNTTPHANVAKVGCGCGK